MAQDLDISFDSLVASVLSPLLLYAAAAVFLMLNVPVLGYFTRLMRVFAASYNKPKLRNWWEGSTLDRRVNPSDIDIFFHMNNSRYLYNMDFARGDWFIRADYWNKLVVRNKIIVPVVGSASIKYRRELNPFQRYQIVTEPLYFDDKYFYLLQQFVSPETRYVHSAGLVKYVFLHKGQKVTPANFFKEMGLLPAESNQTAGISPKLTESKQPVSIDQDNIDLHDVPTLIKYFSESECNLPLDCLLTSKKHN
eukprot:TRINITY_DN3298_c0_g2_i2.p1 TRINITY_DN3298_c0_g2~~TRINITY_DN3298_c0_g2_i2.p1  ORF type:complete len:251 (+),score=46.45 TRINITY_DN3298_c0_g2_i2:99-851(+)